MHNFIVKFGKNLDIYNKFVGNCLVEKGYSLQCDVVPNFTNLEVIALSNTIEALGIVCNKSIKGVVGATVHDAKLQHGYNL